jgi:anti-sigma regulatory factor (Ser/Thr protein kinase)
MAKQLTEEAVLAIKRELVDGVDIGTVGLVSATAREFNISRQTVNRILNEMVSAGELTASGTTRARKYALVVLEEVRKTFPLAGLSESDVWVHHIAHLFKHQKSTAMSLANFAFTEMVNNAIDHSEGTSVTVTAIRTARTVKLRISDDGIGIFKKIQIALGLEDPSHSILELAKGKLTTDPARHSGLGVFFSSRACESFMMLANGLAYSHAAAAYDFLLKDEEPLPGTLVIMDFDLYSTRSLSALFKEYEAESVGGFSKTIVPVHLAEYGSENLVSRSQAKRALTRVERFTEVIWDFAKVDEVGQAFADEIFRVFPLANPDSHFSVVNATKEVAAMITLATATLHEQAPNIRETIILQD